MQELQRTTVLKAKQPLPFCFQQKSVVGPTINHPQQKSSQVPFGAHVAAHRHLFGQRAELHAIHPFREHHTARRQRHPRRNRKKGVGWPDKNVSVVFFWVWRSKQTPRCVVFFLVALTTKKCAK